MTTPVRRRMGVEERRSQLVGVALELFRRRSPEEVSVDEIARAAGVSRPLVYHYFPAKSDLREAALRRAVEESTARLSRTPGDAPAEGLLDVTGCFFDFVEEHGAGYAAFLRSDDAGARPGEGGTVVDALRRAVYEGVLARLGVADPPARLELAVRSWISLTESTALIWSDGRHGPRAEVETQLVRGLVALIAVSAEHDTETDDLLRRSLGDRPRGGPLADLMGRWAVDGNRGR
ncbi:TetR/AcrR family transcriptional regulator [Streptomyces sp. ZYX-F-203]